MDQSSQVDLLVVLLVEIDSHLQFQNDDSENDEIVVLDAMVNITLF